VTDGEQRAALAVVRALGAAGHRVEVCSSRGRSLAGASRYARHDHPVPPPLTHPMEYVGEIEHLLHLRGVEGLIPISEPSLLAILPCKKRFPNVQIPFPPAATFGKICDKELVLREAEALGIAVPHQSILTGPDELSARSISRLTFPIVVKPSRSVGGNGAGRTKLGVRHAADQKQLLFELASLPPAAFPVLLQERIQGPGVGIFLLVHEGKVLAHFAHRRIREKPPSGGVSVYRESIEPPVGLVEKSRELLEQFDWSGVAMVEYKLDANSGTPHLMEVNGRFWGSLQLAIDAGVDFPNLLLRSFSGERPTQTPHYEVGVKSRWEWGEVDHLLARLRRSARDLALPADSPGRGRSLLNFVRWQSDDRSEIFRMRDPRPFFRETLDWFAQRES